VQRGRAGTQVRRGVGAEPGAGWCGARIGATAGGRRARLLPARRAACSTLAGSRPADRVSRALPCGPGGSAARGDAGRQARREACRLPNTGGGGLPYPAARRAQARRVLAGAARCF